MTPAEERPEQPSFSYEDLALFLGAILPCLLIATLGLRPIRFPSEGVQAIAFQCAFEGLLLIALYLLIARRYGRPFWRSVGWTLQFPAPLLYLFAGPVLSIALGMLGAALHAPDTPAVQSLMTDRLSLIVVLVFGALLGPIFEEVVFRGFLLLLIQQSLGAWPAILLSAAPFALLHGAQYLWSWQSILIVGLAGVVFGYVRVRTGSTLASTLLHIGYNGTLFGIYLLQGHIT